MDTATSWILGLAVLGGVWLAGVWLQERRPAWWMDVLHGAAGLAGCVLAFVLLSAGSDGQGFGRLAGWFLGSALAGGGLVAVAQLRRRRPSGLVVALHATLGITGLVLWFAHTSLGHQ